MLEVGRRAPEFTLATADGTEISLTALLNRGPVLLHFLPPRLPSLSARGLAGLTPLIADGLLQFACIAPHPALQVRRLRHLVPRGPLLADSEFTVTEMYDAGRRAGFGLHATSYLVDTGRIVRGAARTLHHAAPYLELARRARELLGMAPHPAR